MKLKLLLCAYLCFHIIIGYSQSITLTSVDPNCFNNNTMTSTTSNGGTPNRRIYTGLAAGGQATTVRWATNRWEVQVDLGSIFVVYINSSTSAPNAPSTGWLDAMNTACGNLTSSVVLRVELTQFDAQNTEGGKTNLTWATASETNNKGFDIERSRDGETFQTIGNVKGIGKAANYNFVDANPFGGINYYRLKQVDFDGTETLSKVVTTSTTPKGNSKIKIFPTNTEGSLFIESGQLTIDNVQVFNSVGQLVLSRDRKSVV